MGFTIGDSNIEHISDTFAADTVHLMTVSVYNSLE